MSPTGIREGRAEAESQRSTPPRWARTANE